MKLISILCLVTLVGCNSIHNHKDDFKAIGHDVLDEGIDDVEMEYCKKTKRSTKAAKVETTTTENQ